MTRPTLARISLGAFADNYRLACSLAPRSRVVAVVKADAYGHGAVALARSIADQAHAFGVASLEEAMELRESGIDNRILLLEGVFSATELDLVDRLRLSQVIHARHQIDWLVTAHPAHPFDVWLKVDTGMHRLGFPPTELASAFARLRRSPQVAGITLMSHFARADEIGSAATQEQIKCFTRCVSGLSTDTSLANSAAVLAWPDSHGDWVRPGIMLYGCSPLDSPGHYDAKLRPVMCLESQIIATRQLATGESIGYGGRYRCMAPTRVGVVAIGYADGYPRHAQDGTPVAVNGQRSRIIGRVSMDMLTVDLTGVADAGPGTIVQLWGDLVSANEVALYSEAIAYQLFTGVSRRVPRIYE